MRTIEYRATVIVHGNAMTFDPPYGADESGTWVVGGNELRIDLPSGHTVVVRVS